MIQYDFHAKDIQTQQAYLNFPFEPEILVSYCVYPVSNISIYNNMAYIQKYIHYANDFYNIPLDLRCLTTANLSTTITDKNDFMSNSIFIPYTICLYNIIEMFRKYEPYYSCIDSKDAILFMEKYTLRFLDLVGLDIKAFGQLLYRDFEYRYSEDLQNMKDIEWTGSILYNDSNFQRFYEIASSLDPNNVHHGIMVSPYYQESDEILVDVTYRKYLKENAVNMNSVPEDKFHDFLSDMYSEMSTIERSIQTAVVLSESADNINNIISKGNIPYLDTEYSSVYLYNFDK